MAFRANLQGLDEIGDAMEEVVKMSAEFRAERARLSKNLSQDLTDPHFRRTFVRLECAALEGMTACMKRAALAAAEYSGVTFSKAELEVLRDEKFVSTRKNAEICWRAFRRSIKASNSEANVSMNWDAYEKAIGIRNRVVHPKRVGDLHISEAEIVAFVDGLAWFAKNVAELARKASTELKGLTRQKKIHRRTQPKLGRNEICPGGCGQKVKNCQCSVIT